MSAYLELRRTGTMGPAAVALLYDTVRRALHRTKFAPLRHDTDVEALAHDFLDGPTGLSRVVDLVINATDDESLSRLLYTAVERFLIDQVRRTDRGALHRRLASVVSADDNDLRLADTALPAWTTLTHADGLLWGGDDAELIAASYDASNVTVLRWRSERRRDPVADRQSLVSVMTRVIEQARGPVPTSTMVRVIEARFSLATRTVRLSDDEPGDPFPAPGDGSDAHADAVEIFNQLTDRERRVLAVIDQPVREIADAVQIGKSTAATTLTRLKALLSAAVANTGDIDSVWAALRDLADDFVLSLDTEGRSDVT